MKNLKKVLSLALALTMTAGLFATTAFAKDADSYTDAGQINNKEAVSVLSGLGVIAGKGDGSSFDPTANVTRAEMAKMITWSVLGDVDVSAFVGTQVPLNDLGLAAWAEGYMKYCYSQGFISGRGNGRFDPNANVTTAEACRMLLGAIGYHSEVQGYTGTNWKINTIRDAQISGFFDNLSVTSDKALTRDEAAQLIYNAIQATLIVRTSGVDRVDGKITDNYAPTTTDKPLEKNLLGKTFKAYTWISTYEGNDKAISGLNKGEIQFKDGGMKDTAKNARTTTVRIPSDIDISNIGEEYKIIFKDGTNGTKERPDKYDTIYGVFKTGNTQVVHATRGDVSNLKAVDNHDKIKVAGTIYDLVKWTRTLRTDSDGKPVKDGNNNDIYDTTGGASVYWNYVNVTNRNYIDSYDVDSRQNAPTTTPEKDNSELTNRLMGTNGDTIKMILNDDNRVESIYVTNYQIAKVTGVSSSRITLKGIGNVNTANAETYSGIAKDDIIVAAQLYDTDVDKAYFTVKKAESVEGTMSGYKADRDTNQVDPINVVNLVVNGTTYPAHNKALADITDDAVLRTNIDSGKIGDTVRLYMINGYIGAAQTINSSGGNYAVVTSQTSGNGEVFGTGLNSRQLEIILSDGTKKVVRVHQDSTNNGQVLEANAAKEGNGDTKNRLVTGNVDINTLIEYSSISTDNVIRIKKVIKQANANSAVSPLSVYEIKAKTGEVWNKTTKKLADDTVPAAKSVLFVLNNGNYYAYDLRTLGNIKNNAENAVDTYMTCLTNSENSVSAAFVSLQTRPTASTASTLFGMVTGVEGTTVGTDSVTYQIYTVAVGREQDVRINVDNNAVKLAKGDLVQFDENTVDQQYGQSDIAVISAAAVPAAGPDKAKWYAAFGRDFSGDLLRYYTAATKDGNGVWDGDKNSAKGITISDDVRFVYIDAENQVGTGVAGDKSTGDVNGVDAKNGLCNLVFHTNNDGNVDFVIVETSGKASLAALDTTVAGTHTILVPTQG